MFTELDRLDAAGARVALAELMNGIGGCVAAAETDAARASYRGVRARIVQEIERRGAWESVYGALQGRFDRLQAMKRPFSDELAAAVIKGQAAEVERLQRETFRSYQASAARTEKPLANPKDRMQHAILGILSEAGELASAIKRHAIYDQVLDEQNVAEELGDLLFYVALMANALRLDLGRIATGNLEKLRLRYPEGFTAADALERRDEHEHQEVAHR
jgi:NTP pyrophosphatase (non-canonical NTP hydrolase)